MPEERVGPQAWGLAAVAEPGLEWIAPVLLPTKALGADAHDEDADASQMAAMMETRRRMPSTAEPTYLVVMCAWCGADLGRRPSQTSGVSHGICKPCAQRLLSALAAATA